MSKRTMFSGGKETPANNEIKWERYYGLSPIKDRWHCRHGNTSARVMELPNGLWEWSTWLGTPAQQVLHQRGEVKLKSSAKRAAMQALLKSDRHFPPSI